MDRQSLCDVMPIIEKAAPLVASFIGGPISGLIISLLALLVNCNPHDNENLIKKLKEDPDLYAKLSNLESTHGQWLKTVSI